MSKPKTECSSILFEALVVIVVGVGLALAANAVSPNGLSLTRDYFPAGATNVPPKSVKPVSPPAASTNLGFTNPATNQISDAEELSQRLLDKGLQEIKRPAVEKLLRESRTLQGAIIFVDARDEDHYAEGHLPGAYEFDPYHPEKQMGTVIPICQAARQVIVYCTGGECEDADTTAILLRDAGVSANKIFVYGGGFMEWEDAHLPLETGARNSGVMKSDK